MALDSISSINMVWVQESAVNSVFLFLIPVCFVGTLNTVSPPGDMSDTTQAEFLFSLEELNNV